MPEKTLSDADIDVIATRTAEKLKANTSAFYIDEETHYNHHKYVSDKIARDEEFSKAIRKIGNSAVTWALLIALAFVGKSVLFFVVEYFKRHPGA